jgi:Fe-S cluster biogenesis protein NfuA
MEPNEIKGKVEAALNDVKAFLQHDGGDCELVEITGEGVVKVRLQGSCVGCPFANITLKMRVEAYVRERVPEIKEVVSVE